jgi:hypothetical protein
LIRQVVVEWSGATAFERGELIIEEDGAIQDGLDGRLQRRLPWHGRWGGAQGIEKGPTHVPGVDTRQEEEEEDKPSDTEKEAHGIMVCYRSNDNSEMD